ncbi:MAG: hypothetical protein NTU66_06005 [Elusimicrobia bacterium]|nr:hypothetical protein [Elusimicrobiota bacterium]
MVRHSTLSGVELHNPFNFGLDVNKPASPAAGQWYFATDTQVLYFCTTANTWTNMMVIMDAAARIYNTEIRVETCTADPSAPSNGRIWLRTDI